MIIRDNILVDDKNKEEIEEALNAAQGKETKRLATYWDVKYAAAKLLTVCYSREALEGCTLRYITHARVIPNATDTPKSTYVDVSCIDGKFYMTGAGRTFCNRITDFNVLLTDKAKQAIIESIESGHI